MTVSIPEQPPPVVQGSVEDSFYDTYNTRYIPPPQDPMQDTGGGGYFGPNFVRRAFQRVPPDRPVPVRGGVPKFLGNRQVIIGMWLVAMLTIGFDEWHNYGVLPRPARLWYTSVVYGLLAIVSIADPLVPICTALAVGFTIALGYQYFESTGQFQGSGAGQSIPLPKTTKGMSETTAKAATGG